MPKIVLLISERYNANPKNQSLLYDMIFYGKSYLFVETMIPNIQDTLITGYSHQEIDKYL